MSAETDTQPLTVGTYWVDLPCPRCGALETVLVRLSSVLTEGTDEDATLRLKAGTKRVDHMCGQRRMLDTADLLPLHTEADR